MRFIAGCFASTPLTCAGGTISDLWNPLERVFSFPIFANAAFTGPLLGPVMGGYIVMFLDWRWVEWITLIASGLVLTIVVLFQPETYPPILLKWKAQHLRELTGDERYRSEMEIRQQTFLHRLQRALWRPFLLTSREPIIILIALYLTVIYIVLFGFLDGYPYIFTDVYGINEGLTGLCFLGIIVGLFGATALVPIIYKWAKRDLQKIQEQGGDRLLPEFRLWYMFHEFFRLVGIDAFPLRKNGGGLTVATLDAFMDPFNNLCHIAPTGWTWIYEHRKSSAAIPWHSNRRLHVVLPIGIVYVQ
ncbi:MFS general substrate transporter [Hortaea werneckii]|nr:MFS general substrate transporter [Hortaea werneckii]